jgi:hypothetical protein
MPKYIKGESVKIVNRADVHDELTKQGWSLVEERKEPEIKIKKAKKAKR